jgi:hypothetical protein
MRRVRMSRKAHFKTILLDDKAQAPQRTIELIEVQRLPQISIAARLERCVFHSGNVKRGYRHDRDLLAGAFEFAQLADGLQSIKHRHVQINDEEAGPPMPRDIQRFLPVLRFKNGISFQLKGTLEHDSRVLRIFRKQNSRIKYCRDGVTRQAAA